MQTYLKNGYIVSMDQRDTVFDGGGVLVEDDKIIAVHVDDPEYNHYTSIDELPPHCLKTLKRFFEDYKILENKEVIIETFLGPEDARQTIREALKLYDDNKETLPGYGG